LQIAFPSVEVNFVVVRQSNTARSKRLKWPSYVLGGGAIGLVLALIGLWLASPVLTYKGVPLNILLKFVADSTARKAYFSHNREALHDRLQQMGVEESIKAYYRPKIQNEQALDRYIHQLMYNSTGYVGKAYTVNAQGILVNRSTTPPEFQQWFALAHRLDLVTSYKVENDEILVKTPKGTQIPFSVISNLYSLSDLEKWVALQR
jgi:hypothetical protein